MIVQPAGGPSLAAPALAKPKTNARVGPSRGKGIKKSRLGCRNCKIRKVKCDETKPKCKKCTTFGVSCNYSTEVHADLHMASETVYGDGLSMFSVQDLQNYSRDISLGSVSTYFSPNSALLGMMNSALRTAYTDCTLDRTQVYQLSIEDLGRVQRFQERTVLTIGSPKVGVRYQKQLIKMFCSKPHVMHAALTLTAMHDRLLSDPTATQKTNFECYHLSQAAKLFHLKLAPPIAPDDWDPVWATTGMMACISFFATEAATAEESWPMNEAALPTALDWLKLEDAFKILFVAVKPNRPDGIFNDLFKDATEKGYLWETSTKSGTKGLLPELVDLCNLECNSDDFNNPYHTAVRNLESLLELECTPWTRMRFLVFCARMRPDFKTLLAQRDPRALLLMSYWYATIFQANWYIVRRARVECQSIILYLERYHAHDTAIMKLLDFPRKKLQAVKFKPLPVS